MIRLVLDTSFIGVRQTPLRPYGAGVSADRFHRACALGYFPAPLTGLGVVQTQEQRRGSAPRRRHGLRMRKLRMAS